MIDVDVLKLLIFSRSTIPTNIQKCVKASKSLKGFFFHPDQQAYYFDIFKNPVELAEVSDHEQSRILFGKTIIST